MVETTSRFEDYYCRYNIRNAISKAVKQYENSSTIYNKYNVYLCNFFNKVKCI